MKATGSRQPHNRSGTGWPNGAGVRRAKRIPGPFPLQDSHLLAQGEYLCRECRTVRKGLADDGEKFQSFRGGWNKWEAQVR